MTLSLNVPYHLHCVHIDNLCFTVLWTRNIFSILLSSDLMSRLFCSMGQIPELDFLHPDSMIILNVGGQIFETTSDILTRDPYSILACLCRKTCPVPCDPDPLRRSFFLDRDWWIFRHVLSFLRSDILPSDLDTLKELYKEAIYYRVQSLQRAIENFPVDQVLQS